LTRLSKWSQQDLQALLDEAGGTENSLHALAMEKRGTGIGLWRKGSLTEAMEQFRESWALLAISYRDDRNNRQTFFELGQAEFYIGQTYMEQGDLAAAEKAFMAYAEITRRLITLEPKNAEWVLEMAFALSNLGSLQKSRDESMPERTLQFMQSSLEYNQIALVLDPANTYYQSELGQSHAFLADAQLDVCDLEGALSTRQEHVRLDKELLARDPDSSDRRQKAAFAETGLATVQDYTGDIRGAIGSLYSAITLLEKNASENTADRNVKVDILLRQGYLAHLLIQDAQVAEARRLVDAVSASWQMLQGITSEDMRTSLEYVRHLVNQARLLSLENDEESAIGLFEDIQHHLVASQDNMTFRRKAGNMLVEVAFYQWEITGEPPGDRVRSSLPVYELGRGWARACMDADSAVLKSIMLGELDNAQSFAAYLLRQGYRQAGFMRVCDQYALCSGQ
jgi:tetratricopeptide (TPR) repeat protein